MDIYSLNPLELNKICNLKQNQTKTKQKSTGEPAGNERESALSLSASNLTSWTKSFSRKKNQNKNDERVKKLVVKANYVYLIST